MKNEEFKQYLQTQIVQSPRKLKGWVSDIHGNPLFKRAVFSSLEKYMLDFLKNKTEPRIIVMPGLRGTGKTTLLAQLFLSLPEESVSRLYLSVDEAVKRFNVNLWTMIECYEELYGKHIEELNEPLFLFLDEIHYDKDWAIFLKTMYDRSKNIMVFSTGSAALLLREQINADVARRVYFVDIHPISFSEYLLLKDGKNPITGVGENIKSAILLSSGAKEVFTKLKQEESRIQRYWLEIDSFEIQRYLMLGTFPFTLSSENEVLAMNFVSQIINKVIFTDIPQFINFEIETLNKIEKILYLIADTLGVSAVKLSSMMEMKIDTLSLVLKSLEDAGLLIRIPPYGAHFKQVRKPSKYLFATPALRFSYLASRESIRTFDIYQGSLLEDVIGMYLNRTMPQFGIYSLTYDAASGGADFILTVGNKKIVLEAGIGKKDYKQITKTAKKINPHYSLIVSEDGLEYSQEQNSVKIPLKYFLLI